jgi:hypothetical protein
MIAIGPRQFREVWLVDFEFSVPPGERPTPVCLVAREFRTGRTVRLWQDEIRGRKSPPYSVGPDDLLVAYFSSAEMGCHLVNAWELPRNILDLYPEFRRVTNGLETRCGNSLLGALTYFGLDSLDASEKDGMRQLAMRGGPWTSSEMRALLDYCESDVVALERLLPKMLPQLDISRALLRGRYMAAVARMEFAGIPVDLPSLSLLRKYWPQIGAVLVARINSVYGVYEEGVFRAELFARWLAEHDVPWPRLPTGRLALDEDTFREMARVHPEVAPLRELRCSLAQLRLNELSVGRDGRNRCLISPFSARTGRNQPSNSQFIFGPAVWIRGLIRPGPGYGLAYVDWSQQEFGIAAALSKDERMMAAYASGDPYLAFAKHADAVPADATKATHGPIREQFKACALAVQYGMEAESLGQRIGQPKARARELLQLHRESYPKFWRWSDSAVDLAMTRLVLWTVFGWPIHAGTDVNPRSLRNFPMQANGAEMLRLACCLATERGIRVCAPVHDALLIEAPLAELDDAIIETQRAMAEASKLVLDGFELRSDVKPVRYPDRYSDERGARMWATVWQIIDELEGGRAVRA